MRTHQVTLALLCFAGSLSAQQQSGSAAMDQVLRSIDAKRDAYAGVAKQIWAFAEVGYQEEKSSALLQQQLARRRVRGDGAASRTCRPRSSRPGAPGNRSSAIVGEFDALPGSVAGRRSRPRRRCHRGRAPDTAAATTCSAPASAAAAIAVKEWLIAAAVPGRSASTARRPRKAGRARSTWSAAGLFKDVDAVIAWHPGDRNEATPGEHLANVIGQVPLPRRLGARGGRAGQGPVRARRRRSHELHGEHDARARAAGNAHPLRHHARRRRAERRARLRRGLLLRAAPGHARCSTAIWERIVNAAKGAALGTGDDDGARGDRRGLQRAAERVPGDAPARTSNASAASPTRRGAHVRRGDSEDAVGADAPARVRSGDPADARRA